MLRTVAVVVALAFSVPHIPAHADNLPVSCIGISTMDTTQQGMTVKVTNNCGRCAKARVNALKDGKPNGFDGIKTLQPNQSQTDYVPFNGYGNYQYVVIEVKDC